MDLALVRHYEPVLRFRKSERFFPMRVEEYVSECSLHAMEGGRGVMRIPPPYVNVQALAEFPSMDHYLIYADRRVADPAEEANLRRWIERQKTTRIDVEWRKYLQQLKDKVIEIGLDLQKLYPLLNLPHEVLERAVENYGGLSRHAPVYHYRVTDDGDYTAIQYWFFYAFNDFATSFEGFNDHEGDWESVYLFFKSGKPVWATYASHIGHGLQLGRPWEPAALEIEDDHPVVYVAGGSHASYHTREAHLPDREFADGDVIVGGHHGLAWAEPVALDWPWFTDYMGRWGSYQWHNPIHLLADSGGGPPTGPKFQRDGSLRPQWDHPAKFAGLMP